MKGWVLRCDQRTSSHFIYNKIWDQNDWFIFKELEFWKSLGYLDQSECGRGLRLMCMLQSWCCWEPVWSKKECLCELGNRVDFYLFLFFERLDYPSQSFWTKGIRAAKNLISVRRRFMNLYVEGKADADKAGKVKSCFACNSERDINVGFFDCKVLWEPCAHSTNISWSAVCQAVAYFINVSQNIFNQ